MPLDSQGQFRHNHESAAFHSAGGKAPKEDQSTGDVTEVHAHGDGTFHTAPDQVQHETIGHLQAHLSKLHGQDGEKHFHAHHDGGAIHSHSVESGGEPRHEEHAPDDTEGVSSHLHEAMGGEQEPGDQGEEASAGAQDGGSLY